MEIKYLSGQDDQDIHYPLVHVDGIVGLNVTPTVNVSNQNIPLTSPYLVAGSNARVVYFDNIVYASVDLSISPEGITYLSNDNTIEITDAGLSNTEDVVLDCRSMLKDATSLAVSHVWIKGGKIYIRVSCKDNTFAPNPADPTKPLKTVIKQGFDKIVGNALSTTKSFAPIKPIAPNGYIKFSFPARVKTISMYIDASVAVAIESSVGNITFDRNASNIYTINVQSSEDYILTIKGTMFAVVYPRDLAISAVEIHDCASLTWFSVLENANRNKMIQNTSIVEFSIYGKHKLYNMAYMLENLVLLETVKSLYTTGVTNMTGCFKGCSKLRALPVMDLTSVISAGELCYACSALSSVPNGMDWGRIIDGQYMFYQCENLITLPVMNTSAMSYCNNMFFGCANITSLEMQGPAINDTTDMLVACRSLANITMTGIKKSLSTIDTNLRTKAAVVAFINNAGTTVTGSVSILQLPQTLDLYGFDNAFIATVTAKNWQLRG